MNFGPLSRLGGERRLNVAITRARRKVEFVTSVRVSDFALELETEGARHLRRYLQFAERAEERMAMLAGLDGGRPGEYESPFEEEVGRVVLGWGYDVVPQVGCSEYRIDLGARHPVDRSRYVLGIECDGAMYHSSRAARDRDRLRQEVLENLGWRLHRIWGPAWYRHRSDQEAHLKAAIEDAVLRAESPAARRESVPESATLDPVEVDLDVPPTWAEAYRAVTLPLQRPGLEMHELAAQAALQEIIIAVVRGEGPVHAERVLRKARESFGKQSARERIRLAFDRTLTTIERVQPLLRESGFLRLQGQVDRVRRPVAGQRESLRSIEEVPAGEIELAVDHLVQDARRIEKRELVVALARLFGWRRSGPQIASSVSAAARRLVESRRIGETAEEYLAVD